MLWLVHNGAHYFVKLSYHHPFCVAGVRPGSRGTFVSAKVPKTIDAQSGLMRGDGRKTQEGEPTRCAQTRLAGSEERPSRGPDSRRRILEDEHDRKTDERVRNHVFCMIQKNPRPLGGGFY